MPPYQVSTSQVLTVTAGGAEPGLPMKALTMQDIRLIAGEGRLPAWAVLDAVNTILRRRGVVV